MTRKWITDVSEDDLFILREAVGFYLDIVEERERLGDDQPGTHERAERLADELGVSSDFTYKQ